METYLKKIYIQGVPEKHKFWDTLYIREKSHEKLRSSFGQLLRKVIDLVLLLARQPGASEYVQSP
jgi:hypothetical protein